VARQCEIEHGLKRRSRVQMLLGDNGWVGNHREQGITYGLDVTQSMFSSGNGTEKMRMGRVCRHDDIVVDLYAGIGYFTLPFLVHGHAKHVHACELNPESVKALRYNLEVNGVASRATVYPGSYKRRSFLCFVNALLMNMVD
jgi:tRNA G37 N-methylase Trm5